MGKYVRYLHGTPDIGTVNILDGEVPVVRELRFGLMTPYLFAEKPEGFHIEEESGISGWRLMRQDTEQMTTWVLTGEEGKMCIRDRDWKDYTFSVRMRSFYTKEPAGILFRYQTSLMHYGFRLYDQKAQLVRAVSYTHLDVYKRQRYIKCRWIYFCY